MATTVEIVATSASVISAVGGAFAAWAAFRSAGFAREAQGAAAETERRAALRQVVLTAAEVQLEARRAQTRSVEVLRALRGLAVFSGAYGGSRQKVFESAVEEKVKRVTELSEHAKLFAPKAPTLLQAPLDEIDRIHTTLSANLEEVRSMREDFEKEFANLDAQCAVYREKVIKG